MRLLIIALLLLVTACQSHATSVREIDMYNGSGDMTGTATFTEQSDGVQVKVEVEGLSPGFHGIQLHENPTCKGPGFRDAGNHFNPEGKKHGLMNPEGHHMGDLPNVKADDSGKVKEELMLEDATLLENKNSILQEGGTSLIIHKNKDDGISQPGGNAGAREMCGELKTNPEEGNDRDEPTDPTQMKEEKKDED